MGWVMCSDAIVESCDTILVFVVTVSRCICALSPAAENIILRDVGVGSGSRFDTAYWSFLRVWTTFDIFQNIHILYLEYGVLTSSGYDILIFFPLWSLVSAGTDTPYLP
ncbi:hypothetical protein Tco_0135054 [Tanacetum coccineum]